LPPASPSSPISAAALAHATHEAFHPNRALLFHDASKTTRGLRVDQPLGSGGFHEVFHGRAGHIGPVVIRVARAAQPSHEAAYHAYAHSHHRQLQQFLHDQQLTDIIPPWYGHGGVTDTSQGKPIHLGFELTGHAGRDLGQFSTAQLGQGRLLRTYAAWSGLNERLAQHQLIHYDAKPGNICLANPAQPNRLRYIDVDAIGYLDPAATETPNIGITAGYLAPEVYVRQAEVRSHNPHLLRQGPIRDPVTTADRASSYALGVSLLEHLRPGAMEEATGYEQVQQHLAAQRVPYHQIMLGLCYTDTTAAALCRLPPTAAAQQLYTAIHSGREERRVTIPDYRTPLRHLMERSPEDRAIAGLLAGCLHPDPRERPPARELRQHLRQLARLVEQRDGTGDWSQT
jgi:serine/threonine protein kinase